VHNTDSRGANCCLEIRTILGCDPVGPCLGYVGNCGDLQDQFADLQGPFLYSAAPGEEPSEQMSLADWVCHAFPDDAFITADLLVVGLLCVAVALPVDLFLARLFEIANEGAAPEAWLDALAGSWQLLLGKEAHNGWRLGDARRPVRDLCAVGGALLRGAAAGGSCARTALAGARGHRAPARRAAAARGAAAGTCPSPPSHGSPALPDTPGDAASSGGASQEARADALAKRLYAAAGLLGVYFTWCIFAWFIFVRHCFCQLRLARSMLTQAPPQTYGMLIYTTLGDGAQAQFAQTWGVG
jgi:hypothetical protein